MQRRNLLCLPLAPFLALFAAQGKGKGKGKGHSQNSEGDSYLADVRFRREDVRVIVGYFGPGGGLPPGLAKRGGALPPGLEKQLRRKGKLPPGLEKKLVPFPAELEVRLPPVQPGCRRVIAGGWAMLIHDATNVILDVVDLSRR